MVEAGTPCLRPERPSLSSLETASRNELPTAAETIAPCAAHSVLGSLEPFVDHLRGCFTEIRHHLSAIRISEERLKLACLKRSSSGIRKRCAPSIRLASSRAASLAMMRKKLALCANRILNSMGALSCSTIFSHETARAWHRSISNMAKCSMDC